MTLSSSFAIYLHNLFHPATFFVLFTIMLLASIAFAELLLFALLAACLTFVFHRLTPLHSLPGTYAVLLTGSSSGIGEEVALRLASLGLKVFAGVRKEADGYRLQVKARQFEGNIVPLLLDVTNERHIQAAHIHIRATCEQKGWRLYAIVLNAGLGEYGPVEMISAARMRRQYEVNVVAPHVLTQTFLPLLRLSASPPPSMFLSAVSPFTSSTPLQPRVLFMSSVASRVTVPGRGVYCSSKHALESLSSAYRVELQSFGIRVVSICPGELYSSFHNNSKRMYAEVVRECTERAVRADQQSSGAPASSSSSSSSVPLPLSRQLVAHYDRVYSACRQRWRIVGSPDIAADAVEVALRTRWPLSRYDCGDDAAALPLIQLIPSKWVEFALGLPFYTHPAPHNNQYNTEAKTEEADDREATAGSAVNTAAVVEGEAEADSRRTEAVRRISGRSERAMEKERREAADEEKQGFISGTDDVNMEEGEAEAVYTVDEVTHVEPPNEPRALYERSDE